MLNPLFIVSSYAGGALNNDQVEFEFSEKSVFDLFANLKKQQKLMDQNIEIDQKPIPLANENEYSKFSVLNHRIYESDRIRFFNFTAFDQKDLKNKLSSGEFSINDLDSLHITFGYGIEYLLKENQTIGYEFLSSFPYDRGRLIRIFWNQAF